MTNAEHIFSWIENSREHYNQLLLIGEYKRTSLTTFAASKCFALARDAFRDMRADMPEPYSTTDILEAAILIANWELEG